MPALVRGSRRSSRKAVTTRAPRRIAQTSSGFTRTTGYFGRYNRRPTVARTDQELKFHDVDANVTVQDLSAGIIINTSSINLIPQGTTESTRIGRKCTLKAINFRGVLLLNETAATVLTSPQTVRIMLVKDAQCNGAAPTVTGVLETADYLSYNNLANKSRFHTLFDKSIQLNVQGAAGNGTANDSAARRYPVSFYKRCNIDLEFDNTTGAITEIRSNNLFLLIIASDNVASTSLDSKVRLRFLG